MYACGPTVYARAHIGNFRTFVCVDVLRRTLKYLCGYDVREVVNYTDVDDKTIAGAQEAGVPLREYTEQWIGAFRDDADAARHRDAGRDAARDRRGEPAAMGDMILALERNGHTYRRDGSIYFKIATLPAVRPAGAARSRRHEGRRAASTSTNTPRTTRATSCCGRRRKPGEPSWDFGDRPGPARAGTSSARRWRCGCWASRRSTFTPAAST